MDILKLCIICNLLKTKDMNLAVVNLSIIRILVASGMTTMNILCKENSLNILPLGPGENEMHLEKKGKIPLRIPGQYSAGCIHK